MTADREDTISYLKLHDCRLWLPISQGPGPGFPVPISSIDVTMHRRFMRISMHEICLAANWTVEFRTTNLQYAQEWIEQQQRIFCGEYNPNIRFSEYKRDAELEIGAVPLRMYGMFIQQVDFADTGLGSTSYDPDTCLVKLHADHVAWEHPGSIEKSTKAAVRETIEKLHGPDPLSFRITQNDPA